MFFAVSLSVTVVSRISVVHIDVVFFEVAVAHLDDLKCGQRIVEQASAACCQRTSLEIITTLYRIKDFRIDHNNHCSLLGIRLLTHVAYSMTRLRTS